MTNQFTVSAPELGIFSLACSGFPPLGAIIVRTTKNEADPWRPIKHRMRVTGYTNTPSDFDKSRGSWLMHVEYLGVDSPG